MLGLDGRVIFFVFQSSPLYTHYTMQGEREVEGVITLSEGEGGNYVGTERANTLRYHSSACDTHFVLSWVIPL